MASKFLDATFRSWREIGSQQNNRLLKLVLLRDLSRQLHAHRSLFLANPSHDLSPGHLLHGLEHRLKELVDANLQSNDLKSLILALTQGPPLSRPEPPHSENRNALQKSLLATLPAEKIGRYDRFWEFEIALEAVKIGWKFAQLTAWVELSAAENLHSALGQLLWPNGTVLYVESVQTQGTPMQWQGQWVLTLDPLAPTPLEKIHQKWISLSGVHQSPDPSHLVWITP